MVGGTMPSRMAMTHAIASTAAAPPSRWPVMDLVEDTFTLYASSPNAFLLAMVSYFSMAGFQNMKAVHMGDDPTAASIPFDARRSGFVMGEGAGCLVLESLTHAQQRGATILAEVAGYGASGDAYHITSPSPDGEAAAHAIRGAIEDAGLTPADVDYINAHGTSTPLNEKYETIAIKKAFGVMSRSHSGSGSL